jgi:hypothetical protein
MQASSQKQPPLAKPPHAPEAHAQSPGQSNWVSPPLHMPSPQFAHAQSIGHVAHVSPIDASQMPSLHGSHAPQSSWHVMHDSPAPGSQIPLPHVPQPPQSS